jgi:hypothetical protein
MEVLAGGDFGVKADILRDQTDIALERIGITSQRAAADQDLSGIRAQQAGDDGDGGGLPGAVGSEQADGFACAGFEADAIHRDNAAVALTECDYFQH